MILEVAEFTVAPENVEAFATGLAHGADVIRTAEGCLGVQFAQSIEDPQIFILLNRWRTLEDHTVTFRGGPLFAQYRQHINGLFVGQPSVKHYPIAE